MRLLAGELRQGALEGVVLDAVALAADVPAPSVRRAFMLSGRLPETAATALTGGADALDAVRPRGRPARAARCWPAPARRWTPRSPTSARDVTVEFKLDGARIQVHRDGDDVRVWTRTLREVTDGVPELVDGCGRCPATPPSSTARPSRWTTTAAPARSRTR